MQLTEPEIVEELPGDRPLPPMDERRPPRIWVSQGEEYSGLGQHRQQVAAALVEESMGEDAGEAEPKVAPVPARGHSVLEWSLLALCVVLVGLGLGMVGKSFLDRYNDANKVITFTSGPRVAQAAVATPTTQPTLVPQQPAPAAVSAQNPVAAVPAQPAAPSAPAPAPAAPKGWPYTVRPGDRLSDIAAVMGVDVGALAAANGITNPNFIYAGQVLNEPMATGGGGSPLAAPARVVVNAVVNNVPKALPPQTREKVVAATVDAAKAATGTDNAAQRRVETPPDQPLKKRP